KGKAVNCRYLVALSRLCIIVANSPINRSVVILPFSTSSTCVCLIYPSFTACFKYSTVSVLTAELPGFHTFVIALTSSFFSSATVNTTLPALVDGTFTPLITLISYDFGSVHFALTSKCGRSIFDFQSPPHVIPSLRAIAPALTSVATSYSELGGHTAMSHAK